MEAINSVYKTATSASSHVGDVNDLKTTSKEVVGAVNEVKQATLDNKAEIEKNTKAIGNVDELKTTNKDNLVGAVNEVKDQVDKNTQDIANIGEVASKNVGDLSDLSADIKSDTTVGAINNVNDKVNMIGGKLNRLDSKINKVGAGAAALAALHPMDFDPDNKLTFSAGVGNYHGENAAAIGAFYRPNEQVMFSVAGNMGNGENMVNAGITFALDRPSKTVMSKTVMAAKLAEAENVIAAQNEKIIQQEAQNAQQAKDIAELKAMVQQLSAKIK